MNDKKRKTVLRIFCLFFAAVFAISILASLILQVAYVG